MSYERLWIRPEKVYHLTPRRNLDSILKDKMIRRFRDRECWFCLSLEDMLRYMEFTVMNPEARYVDTQGNLRRYPPFHAEDYVILELIPRYLDGEWVKWNQEYPSNSPREISERYEEFSNLKVGYRGNLKFRDSPTIVSVPELLNSAGYSCINDGDYQLQSM